jgi:hypothetical protein
VSNIIDGAIGTRSVNRHYSLAAIYRFVRESVTHEHGRDFLFSSLLDHDEDVHECIRNEDNILVWLDVVELTFRLLERAASDYTRQQRDAVSIKIPVHMAVEELNERFRRAGFGYRYEKGKLIRADSEFIHQEVTRPALLFLSDSRFAGAEQEFRSAHDHLKAGEYKDCCVDALNALESTMKAICNAKGWKYEKGARASDLMKILRRERLFPDFADLSFDQLFATLKSGLPTVRNEAGGHGQGATPVEVPAYVAVYALNLCASKICFLVEALRHSES